jgi:N-dimethylarginine dimethylaminohydrolase
LAIDALTEYFYKKMKITMCSPDFFGVKYEINPWMNINNQPDLELAKEQWRKTKDIFQKLGIEVDTVEPKECCPDMVFTANSGLPVGDKFILSNFTFKERTPEEVLFKDFFSKKFKEIIELPKDIKFEGQGEAFFVGNKFFLGSGFRSSKGAKEEIQKHLPKGYEIIQLELINPKFYHLDTALQYIGDDGFLVAKNAFSENSLKELEKYGNLIHLSQEDSDAFCANCIIFEKNIVMSNPSKELEEKLKKFGFTVLKNNMSEFLKSGGTIRCVSLVY